MVREPWQGEQTREPHSLGHLLALAPGAPAGACRQREGLTQPQPHTARSPGTRNGTRNVTGTLPPSCYLVRRQHRRISHERHQNVMVNSVLSVLFGLDHDMRSPKVSDTHRKQPAQLHGNHAVCLLWSLSHEWRTAMSYIHSTITPGPSSITLALSGYGQRPGWTARPRSIRSGYG